MARSSSGVARVRKQGQSAASRGSGEPGGRLDGLEAVMPDGGRQAAIGVVDAQGYPRPRRAPPPVPPGPGAPGTRIARLWVRRPRTAPAANITANTALRLAHAFGTNPGFWLALQSAYETEEVLRAHGEELTLIQPLAA